MGCCIKAKGGRLRYDPNTKKRALCVACCLPRWPASAAVQHARAGRQQLAQGHVALVLDSRKDKLEVEHPYKVKTFEYLYAPATLTADGVIERMVARVKNPNDTTVVSNDHNIPTLQLYNEGGTPA